MMDEHTNPPGGAYNRAVNETRRSSWSVLVVDSSHAARSSISPVVREMDCAVHFAQSRDEALALVSTHRVDAAIINATLRDGCGLDVLDAIRRTDLSSSVIITSHTPTVDLTVESIRRGACDFIPAPWDSAHMGERLAAALDGVRAHRRRERKISRLRTICRRLNDARREVSDQVDELCTDLVSAYQELASKVDNVSLASEFAASVRQELDIESLLRTVLESMLARTGPTNAAVFLPTGHSDYNLGAYVNQTLAGESADTLLDHLADIIPGEFEDTRELTPIDPSCERWSWICEEAEWLADSCGVVFACTLEGECMAVVLLFRPIDKPFDDGALEDLTVMRDVFAEQLDRIVRVHHRSLPEMPSKGFDVSPDEDDEDDWGDAFGGFGGGMAA